MRHEAVAVLNGEWQRWQYANQAMRQGEEKNTPALFRGEEHPEWIVSLDYVPSAQD